jgi:hypothetical protein
MNDRWNFTSVVDNLAPRKPGSDPKESEETPIGGLTKYRTVLDHSPLGFEMQTKTTPAELAAIDLIPGEIDRPPNCLYRYRQTNEYLRQILVGNLLYRSSPKNFNDPLDCRIPTELSGSPDDVRSYCDRRISEHWPSMPPDEKNLRIDRFISERLWEHTARDVQQKLYNCGVLCLSARWDIPSMWECYAEDHSGVCP